MVSWALAMLVIALVGFGSGVVAAFVVGRVLHGRDVAGVDRRAAERARPRR